MTRAKKGPAIRPTKERERTWILELLDTAKQRQEEAFPEANGDELLYFAHLSAVRQLTETYYRRALQPHRISYSEYRVLSGLRVRGKDFRTTPLDLNRFVQITSAGMTRTLDRLEEAGYIDRSPNPEDRRSVLIGLTPSGWDFAGALGQELNAQYAEMLGDVAAKDLKAAIEALRAVVERLSDAVIR